MILYIHTTMLEPATLSIGLYLIAKSHKNINNRIIYKNPLLFKKKVCKWIKKNHNTIIDTVVDETGNYLLDTLNLINFNPSIYVLMYLLVLVLVVFF